jgi:EAL domain-containing protein (putative c-di-GMP-specific phosphodiesterase class I)
LKEQGLKQDLPWLLGSALMACVAFAVAGYGFGSGTTSVNLIALALAALALGQVIALVRSHLLTGKMASLVESQAQAAGATYKMVSDQQRINVESMNLARSFEQFRTETAELNSTMSEGLALLRQGHETVAENVKSMLETQREVKEALQRPPPSLPPLPVADTAAIDAAIAREQTWLAQLHEESTAPAEDVEPVATRFEESEIGEALSLALEPIVDLYTSATAHYRMVLGMTNAQGHDVSHDIFVHYADNLGLRSQLDQHVIEQTLGLLGQLRQRDPALSIFVPIGAKTLADPETVAKIIEQIRYYPSLAPGVVLDMPHAVLASLHEASIEGLATFARAGVALSLSQASISGVDLAALNRLNVRYIGLTAASVGVGMHVSAGLPGFVQSARALRIQAIISHVGDPRHVQGLSKVARFACGPAFAIPRKLKRNDTQQAQTVAA